MIKSQFHPPQLKPVQTRLIQSIFPLIACWGYQLRLNIAQEDIDRLKAIASSRVVYLPNHSTLDDGIVLFLLSARLGQLWHYIVAYEVFQGSLGKLLQSAGAYSIRRGMGDRPSIIQTLNLLQQEACKLVIFPEGGCSYQNDTVMPFRTGAVELAFKVIAKLVKQGETVPDFYLVPVSLKYQYLQEMDGAIAQDLEQLEVALQIKPNSNDFYLRLRNIAERVLINLETEYNLTSSRTNNDWNQRIEYLKNYLIKECETLLNLDSNAKISIRERTYKIQYLLANNDLTSIKISHKEADYIYKITVRLLNFYAVYDGYVAEKPTAERFIDTINRLKREVFNIDRPPPQGKRQARVVIGDFVNLKEYWRFYQQNPDDIINDLTNNLQKNVQDNITQATK
ncbi:MAG: hypothetical protein Tsb0014_22510 [Pleurocapsa sp.]